VSPPAPGTLAELVVEVEVALVLQLLDADQASDLTSGCGRTCLTLSPSGLHESLAKLGQLVPTLKPSAAGPSCLGRLCTAERWPRRQLLLGVAAASVVFSVASGQGDPVMALRLTALRKAAPPLLLGDITNWLSPR
jgi:hypothetical protein